MCDLDFGGCRAINACPGAPDMCRGDVSLRCAGEATYTRFPCDGGCDATTGLCIEREQFVPSNLGADAFQPGAPDLIIPSGNYELNTDDCRVTNGSADIQTMNSGLSACVWTVGTVETSGSSYVRIFGSLPLILIASGNVSIEGTFDLRAEGNSPGAGGYFGGSRVNPNGSGDSGGLAGGQQEPFGDGGGGGAGGLSDGGRGGAAGDGPARGGEGGPAISSSGEPLLGGSGGGVGPGARGREGNGGGGGGAIQISSLGTLNLQGTIRATGGGGAGGTSASNVSNWGSGGGGGAGGTILLEAPRVEMQGTLSVTGGGGGAGPTNTGNGNENGEDGPTSGTASGGQPGTDGGDGGGSTPDDGDSTSSINGNGGGGGGSAGIVILRATDVAMEGDFNPDVMPVRRTL
ncbi:MAG: hypothetical protein ACI9KE_002005 [Polyangiales bacterium]|jgi:hypothetical protein